MLRIERQAQGYSFRHAIQVLILVLRNQQQLRRRKKKVLRSNHKGKHAKCRNSMNSQKISHLLFTSRINLNKLFISMFPDSEVASKFALGKTKCSYFMNYNIAPHFKNIPALLQSIV